MAEESQESWNDQRIEFINLGDLVLWSENPRDPLGGKASNEDIISRAQVDNPADHRWELDKLAKAMGDEFDFSELPTVVETGDGKYCVYDGNRRVILAMLAKRGISPGQSQMTLPMFPDSIPCNVCPRDKALRHVFRKHNENSTWKAYERDLFSYRYLDGKKTVLIRIEELVGGITRFPQLNQRFVRDDILNDKHLTEIGLDVEKEDYGVSREVLLELLEAISGEIMHDGRLGTRGRRNDPVSVLSPELLSEIRGEVAVDDESTHGQTQSGCDTNSGQVPAFSRDFDDSAGSKKASGTTSRKTRVRKPFSFPIFGGVLTLGYGNVNNIYCTLDSLWKLNETGKIPTNVSFIPIFRMGLRLLAETAASDYSLELDDYLAQYFDEAKANLNTQFGENDIRGYLFANSVIKEKTLPLLQMGAHGKTSSESKDQAIALSLILGSMLLCSHGK